MSYLGSPEDLPRCAPRPSIPAPSPMPSKVPVGRLIQVSPPIPVAGYIKVTYEDGSVKMSPVRTNKRILSMEFEPESDSSPWDYDDPDGDGAFR